MDRTDRIILDMLMKDARVSLKQIAEKAGLSSPAVKTRISKLEQEGIIQGYGVRLDYHALGYLVTAFVSIAVAREDKARFLAFVKDCPQIVECWGITGDHFAMLKVRFPSTMELDNFLTELQVYGETRTNIVLSSYK